jgi:hypothetical protein
MCWVTMLTRSAVLAMGSSVGGSPIVATLMLPPCTGCCAIAWLDDSTSGPNSNADKALLPKV